MSILAEIEGLTSARLDTEQGHNPHLDRRELAWERRQHDRQVYGQSHVNAAYCYTRRGGNRFNDETRGAWYCSWESLVSVAEVAFHKTRELGFIGQFNETARYVELVADFIGEFPDLTDEPSHPALNPDTTAGYPAGQSLARQLHGEGHKGLIYPSVRAPQSATDRRCLVAFAPSIIQSVRPGATCELIWNGGPDYDLRYPVT